jgi:hypothetical protein
MKKSSTKPNSTPHDIPTGAATDRNSEPVDGMDAGNLAAELAEARVHLKRALKQLDLAADDDSRLAWHREVRANLETLARIKVRCAQKSRDQQAAWNTLLDAVRRENKRQKVRR